MGCYRQQSVALCGRLSLLQKCIKLLKRKETNLFGEMGSLGVSCCFETNRQLGSPYEAYTSPAAHAIRSPASIGAVSRLRGASGGTGNGGQTAGGHSGDDSF